MSTSLDNSPDEKMLTTFLPFHVTSADADMNSRLRLGSLVNLLIQGAISSADTLGFGLQLLRNQNLFWVLSRLSVEIYKPLSWYQSGEVETWPKNIDKILYIRDFLVREQTREVVAKATSGWLAVDAGSKRPKTFDAIHTPVFTRLKDKHALVDQPEKLFAIKDGETFEVNTGFFDIDLNGHVTSTRYIDWMMNTFSVEFHQKNYPSKLSINFLHETKPGETISLVRTAPDGKSFAFEGFNKTSNTFAFRGRIEF